MHLFHRKQCREKSADLTMIHPTLTNRETDVLNGNILTKHLNKEKNRSTMLDLGPINLKR